MSGVHRWEEGVAGGRSRRPASEDPIAARIAPALAPAILELWLARRLTKAPQKGNHNSKIDGTGVGTGGVGRATHNSKMAGNQDGGTGTALTCQMAPQ